MDLQTPRNPISWRSVVLGFLGVLGISIITPYNDYVLFNTFVIGNSLPLGAMLMFFLIAVAVNGPLSRFAPRQALSSGELGVAFAMVLVGCAVPSSALMRYLPASLVYPFWQARSDAESMQLLESVKVGRWLYPDFSGAGPRAWSNDPVVSGYAGRWTGEGSPPYGAWIRPMVAWGIYVGFLYGAFMFLFAIIRRQWYENERLPFPLASIELALIEAPTPGRWWNSTMSSRAFWIMFAILFGVHLWNGLYRYFPRYFPEVPLLFDLRNVLAEAPWRYADGDLKRAHLFLTAAAISYFLPGAISFSMWFFFVAWQCWKMLMGVSTGDPGTPGQEDQMFGGLAAYVGIVLWIGRHHWAMVLRQAFRGVRPGEPMGRYLSYRTAFWGMVLCTAGMAGWLTLAGAGVGAAWVITLTVMAGLFVVARIVAETGLLQPGSTFLATRPWTLLGSLGWPRPASVTSVFLAGHLQMLHHDVRESWGVFGTHAIRVADSTVYDNRGMAGDSVADRRLGRKLLLLFAGVLLVGYITSFSSMVWVEYRYAVQFKPDAKPVNDYAAGYAVSGQWTGPTLDYQNRRYNYQHSPVAHVIAGAAITIGLSVMRFRYVWWPLHPVGYLCVGSWPLGQLWFAFFLGWLVRTLVLKFGGSRMYLRARPAMMGVIVGEAVAAGLWMGVGIVISSMGIYLKNVQILPE